MQRRWLRLVLDFASANLALFGEQERVRIGQILCDLTTKDAISTSTTAQQEKSPAGAAISTPHALSLRMRASITLASNVVDFFPGPSGMSHALSTFLPLAQSPSEQTRTFVRPIISSILSHMLQNPAFFELLFESTNSATPASAPIRDSETPEAASSEMSAPPTPPTPAPAPASSEGEKLIDLVGVLLAMSKMDGEEGIFAAQKLRDIVVKALAQLHSSLSDSSPTSALRISTLLSTIVHSVTDSIGSVRHHQSHSTCLEILTNLTPELSLSLALLSKTAQNREDLLMSAQPLWSSLFGLYSALREFPISKDEETNEIFDATSAIRAAFEGKYSEPRTFESAHPHAWNENNSDMVYETPIVGLDGCKELLIKFHPRTFEGCHTLQVDDGKKKHPVTAATATCVTIAGDKATIRYRPSGKSSWGVHATVVGVLEKKESSEGEESRSPFPPRPLDIMFCISSSLSKVLCRVLSQDEQTSAQKGSTAAAGNSDESIALISSFVRSSPLASAQRIAAAESNSAPASAVSAAAAPPSSGEVENLFDQFVELKEKGVEMWKALGRAVEDDSPHLRAQRAIVFAMLYHQGRLDSLSSSSDDSLAHEWNTKWSPAVRNTLRSALEIMTPSTQMDSLGSTPEEQEIAYERKRTEATDSLCKAIQTNSRFLLKFRPLNIGQYTPFNNTAPSSWLFDFCANKHNFNSQAAASASASGSQPQSQPESSSGSTSSQQTPTATISVEDIDGYLSKQERERKSTIELVSKIRQCVVVQGPLCIVEDMCSALADAAPSFDHPAADVSHELALLLSDLCACVLSALGRNNSSITEFTRFVGSTKFSGKQREALVTIELIKAVHEAIMKCLTGAEASQSFASERVSSLLDSLVIFGSAASFQSPACPQLASSLLSLFNHSIISTLSTTTKASDQTALEICAIKSLSALHTLCTETVDLTPLTACDMIRTQSSKEEKGDASTLEEKLLRVVGNLKVSFGIRLGCAKLAAVLIANRNPGAQEGLLTPLLAAVHEQQIALRDASSALEELKNQSPVVATETKAQVEETEAPKPDEPAVSAILHTGAPIPSFSLGKPLPTSLDCPSWIEIDLGATRSIGLVRVVPKLRSAGPIKTQLFAGSSPDPKFMVSEFCPSGSAPQNSAFDYFVGEKLEECPKFLVPEGLSSTPGLINARFLRLVFAAMPNDQFEIKSINVFFDCPFKKPEGDKIHEDNKWILDQLKKHRQEQGATTTTATAKATRDSVVIDKRPPELVAAKENATALLGVLTSMARSAINSASKEEILRHCEISLHDLASHYMSYPNQAPPSLTLDRATAALDILGGLTSLPIPHGSSLSYTAEPQPPASSSLGREIGGRVVAMDTLSGHVVLRHVNEMSGECVVSCRNVLEDTPVDLKIKVPTVNNAAQPIIVTPETAQSLECLLRALLTQQSKLSATTAVVRPVAAPTSSTSTSRIARAVFNMESQAMDSFMDNDEEALNMLPTQTQTQTQTQDMTMMMGMGMGASQATLSNHASQDHYFDPLLDGSTHSVPELTAEALAESRIQVSKLVNHVLRCLASVLNNHCDNASAFSPGLLQDVLALASSHDGHLPQSFVECQLAVMETRGHQRPLTFLPLPLPDEPAAPTSTSTSTPDAMVVKSKGEEKVDVVTDGDTEAENESDEEVVSSKSSTHTSSQEEEEETEEEEEGEFPDLNNNGGSNSGSSENESEGEWESESGESGSGSESGSDSTHTRSNESVDSDEEDEEENEDFVLGMMLSSQPDDHEATTSAQQTSSTPSTPAACAKCQTLITGPHYQTIAKGEPAVFYCLSCGRPKDGLAVFTRAQPGKWMDKSAAAAAGKKDSKKAASAQKREIKGQPGDVQKEDREAGTVIGVLVNTSGHDYEIGCDYMVTHVDGELLRAVSLIAEIAKKQPHGMWMTWDEVCFLEKKELEVPGNVPQSLRIVGTKVKVLRNSNSHNYSIGKVYIVTRLDTDGTFKARPEEGNGSDGNWMKWSDVCLAGRASKVSHPVRALRLNRGVEPPSRLQKNGVRIHVHACTNGHIYTVGKDYIISYVDSDGTFKARDIETGQQHDWIRWRDVWAYEEAPASALELKPITRSRPDICTLCCTPLSSSSSSLHTYCLTCPSHPLLCPSCFDPSSSQLDSSNPHALHHVITSPGSLDSALFDIVFSDLTPPPTPTPTSGGSGVFWSDRPAPGMIVTVGGVPKLRMDEESVLIGSHVGIVLHSSSQNEVYVSVFDPDLMRHIIACYDLSRVAPAPATSPELYHRKMSSLLTSSIAHHSRALLASLLPAKKFNFTSIGGMSSLSPLFAIIRSDCVWRQGANFWSVFGEGLPLSRAVASCPPHVRAILTKVARFLKESAIIEKIQKARALGQPPSSISVVRSAADKMMSKLAKNKDVQNPFSHEDPSQSLTSSLLSEITSPISALLSFANQIGGVSAPSEIGVNNSDRNQTPPPPEFVVFLLDWVHSLSAAFMRDVHTDQWFEQMIELAKAIDSASEAVDRAQGSACQTDIILVQGEKDYKPNAASTSGEDGSAAGKVAVWAQPSAPLSLSDLTQRMYGLLIRIMQSRAQSTATAGQPSTAVLPALLEFTKSRLRALYKPKAEGGKEDGGDPFKELSSSPMFHLYAFTSASLLLSGNVGAETPQEQQISAASASAPEISAQTPPASAAPSGPIKRKSANHEHAMRLCVSAKDVSHSDYGDSDDECYCCDECSERTMPWYHCDECETFDLCQKCFGTPTDDINSAAHSASASGGAPVDPLTLSAFTDLSKPLIHLIALVKSITTNHNNVAPQTPISGNGNGKEPAAEFFPPPNSASASAPIVSSPIPQPLLEVVFPPKPSAYFNAKVYSIFDGAWGKCSDRYERVRPNKIRASHGPSMAFPANTISMPSAAASASAGASAQEESELTSTSCAWLLKFRSSAEFMIGIVPADYPEDQWNDVPPLDLIKTNFFVSDEMCMDGVGEEEERTGVKKFKYANKRAVKAICDLETRTFRLLVGANTELTLDLNHAKLADKMSLCVVAENCTRCYLLPPDMDFEEDGEGEDAVEDMTRLDSGVTHSAGSIPESKYHYYYWDLDQGLTEEDKVNVRVEAESGDPDIFASQIYPRPNSDDCEWKDTCSGRTAELNISCGECAPGRMYLAIRASSAFNSYTVKATYKQAPKKEAEKEVEKMTDPMLAVARDTWHLWTPERDLKLVSLLNKLAVGASSRKIIRMFPMGDEPCTAFNVGKKSVDPASLGIQQQGLTKTAFRARCLLVSHLNGVFSKSLSFVTQHMALYKDLLQAAKPFIFSEMKSTLLFKTLEANSSGECPDVTLRRAAMKPLFIQLRDQLNDKSPKELTSMEHTYRVEYEGEGAVDGGGLFRESLSLVALELRNSKKMGLFKKSSNAEAGVGANRDCIVPAVVNPDVDQKKSYEFVGKLMGIGLRTKDYLELELPSIFWKTLVGDQPSMSDLAQTDQAALTSLKLLLSLPSEEFDAMGLEMYFTTTDGEGREVELVEGGASKPVTSSNIKEYADLAKRYLLSQYTPVFDCILKGFYDIVPKGCLSLFTWQEAQHRICGSPEFDLTLLKRFTSYKQCKESDAHVQLFWNVLESFKLKKRQQFLRFVWGRSRLPLPDEFTDKFSVSEFSSPHGESDDTNQDKFLPAAHTCYFQLDLPKYSSFEVARTKIIYAMRNCIDVDTDGRDTEMTVHEIGERENVFEDEDEDDDDDVLADM